MRFFSLLAAATLAVSGTLANADPNWLDTQDLPSAAEAGAA